MSKNLIIGAGFTAAITNLLIGKDSMTIGSFSHQFLKNKYLRRKTIECNKIFSVSAKSYGSLKFKLDDGILHDRLILGGNSGVWGGNININKIPKNLLKIFKKKNLIFKKLSFLETGTISNIKDIYQLQNDKKKIINTSDITDDIKSGYLESFYIKNKKIFANIFFSKKKRKKLKVKRLYLCIGSLQFLDLLYRSKFLKENDEVEFSEFKHEFLFRFWNLPFSKKFTTVRYRFSRAIGHLFGIQYFSGFLKIFNFLPIFIDQNFYPQKIRYTLQIKNGELIEKKCSLPNYKFGKSIHYCNLKINGININKFLHKIDKNIKGLGMSFINQNQPGPISNEIILDIKKKIKK